MTEKTKIDAQYLIDKWGDDLHDLTWDEKISRFVDDGVDISGLRRISFRRGSMCNPTEFTFSMEPRKVHVSVCGPSGLPIVDLNWLYMDSREMKGLSYDDLYVTICKKTDEMMQEFFDALIAAGRFKRKPAHPYAKEVERIMNLECMV